MEAAKTWNLGLLLEGLLPGLLDQLPKVAHERSMKHQHFQSLSEVSQTKKHGATLEQRSLCRHEEVNAVCCC